MDQKAAAKLQRKPSSSGSKSPSGSAMGPDEAELKILRARFRNRFQTFSKAISKSSSNPNVKGGQLRVKTKKRSRMPETAKSSSIDDEFTPTVFEEVKGGFRPAKTKLRHRDIFRKKGYERSSESDSSFKKTKPSKAKTSKTKSTDSDVSVKKKPKPKSPKTTISVGSKSKEKVEVTSSSPGSMQKNDEQREVKNKASSTISAGGIGSNASNSSNTGNTEAKVSQALPEIKKQLGEYKAKRSLFERMDDEIILDDKVLGDIASDIEKGIEHDSELIDPNLASKLVEIKKNQATVTDADLKEMTDQPFEVNDVANRVVEALTKQEVLGQVLNTDELKVLSEYFNGIRQQDESLLLILNGALEKVLDRASEFYADREELKKFMENRDEAKVLLLDALLSRKSGFLSQLYSNAFYYADVLRDTMNSAYKTVSSACIVANAIAGQSVAAASDGVALASDAINRSANAARDLAHCSQEYVLTAREMGRGLVDGASAVASQTWTTISPARSNVGHKTSSESSTQVKKAQSKEHWLTTLWKVLCSISHLPYAFSEDHASRSQC